MSSKSKAAENMASKLLSLANTVTDQAIDMWLAKQFIARHEAIHAFYNAVYKRGMMDVTKKDYILIADILRGHMVPRSESVRWHKRWLELVKAFAIALERINPDFDRGRFFMACGAIDKDAAKLLNMAHEKTEKIVRIKAAQLALTDMSGYLTWAKESPITSDMIMELNQLTVNSEDASGNPKPDSPASNKKA